MLRTIIIVGLGQLGLSFARGFLKLGHPVIPIGREAELSSAMLTHLPKKLIVLLAVGEDDLQAALKRTSGQLKALGREAEYILLQNELRPDQWLPYCSEPTVSVIWFEQKANKLPHEVQASVHFGPEAPLCHAALTALELKSELPTETEQQDSELSPQLATALVLKNLYILVLNLGGLRSPGSASELYHQQRALFTQLFEEIFTLESALFHQAVPSVALNKAALWQQLIAAIAADPDHGCAGRSAPRRLARSLQHAAQLGLQLPTLEGLGHDFL